MMMMMIIIIISCPLLAGHTWQLMAPRINIAVHLCSVAKCAVCFIGCFKLDSSGETVQCAEVPGLSRSARSVLCMQASIKSSFKYQTLWPNQQWPSAGIPHHKKEISTKRINAQSPLSYLCVTSMGVTVIKDKQKRLRQNIFPLVGSGTFFTVWDCMRLINQLLRC
jgi:hypothetical protein